LEVVVTSNTQHVLPTPLIYKLRLPHFISFFLRPLSFYTLELFPLLHPSTTSVVASQAHVAMFRTSFGFEMLYKAHRRARLKAKKKEKDKKIARYHAHFNKM